MDDAALVVAAREGDREAFAAIYDRYADRIHDFCCSVLRDRAEAADAMQDTFLTASQKLVQLRDPAKLRAWLFAIARHESLRRAKARSRAVPTDDFPDLAASGASPEDEVSRADLTEIVWAAAVGLSERDRVLLDLHLRQGLDGQELANTIGITAGHAYVLMNRLRTQVERSLGALLVARLGRDDCDELSGILRDWNGTFSVLIRKRVARHVDDCDLCGEKRRALVSPLSLLAAVPMIPAPSALRDRVLSRIDLIAATAPVDSQPRVDATADGGRAAGVRLRRSDGFPPAMVATRAARRLTVAAASVVIAAGIGGGAVVALRDSAPGSLHVRASGPSSTSSGASSSTAAAESTASASAAETTTSPGTGVSSASDSTTTTAAGGVSPPTDESSATTASIISAPTPLTSSTTSSATTSSIASTSTTASVDHPPLVHIVLVTNSTIHQTSGKCAPDQSYFEASATDDHAIDHARISWVSKSGSGSSAMTLDNDLWYGTVGPFSDVYGGNTDYVSVTVTAWDSAGQTARALRTITLAYATYPYC